MWGGRFITLVSFQFDAPSPVQVKNEAVRNPTLTSQRAACCPHHLPTYLTLSRYLMYLTLRCPYAVRHPDLNGNKDLPYLGTALQQLQS